MTAGYEAFLSGKAPAFRPSGFEPKAVSRMLKAWQASIVRRGCRLGRMAAFADCGLGKGPIALEWARQVEASAGAPVLILAPLAVAQQFVTEAQKFGLPCSYARNQAEASGPVVATNYERLGEFDPGRFSGVVLDESSILKNYSGKTKRVLVEAFRTTPHRLACTATPAPNDVIELGNHAEFLGVMPSAEMLARWFINDTMEAGKYRLKRHAERDFWLWVAGWAVTMGTPGDLLDEAGQPYPDDGYQLPPLEVVHHVAAAPDRKAPPGSLFEHVTLHATTLHAALRESTPQRAELAAELVKAEPDEAWVVWVATNYEEEAITERLPDAVAVRGDMDQEEKRRRLVDFGEGRVRVLVTKAGIAGYGLNWQHCARHVHLASSFSFEDWYQEARRSYRYGQTRAVRAHVVCASGEERIPEVIAAKQAAHADQRRRAVEAQRSLQLAELDGPRAEVGPAYVKSESSEGWKLHLGDCVEAARRVQDSSVGLHLFSPPFSNLYVYSASLRDMGNCRDDAEFFRHFGYLLPELLRTLKPGRLCVIHCKDLPQYRGEAGALGLRDFPGELTRRMLEVRGADGERFAYHSKVTIWKSPVLEMQKTKSYGLLYKTLRENGSFSRQGLPDYLVVFRKSAPGDGCDDPVKHTPEDYPLELWQRVASPVWSDIRQTRVLNVEAARADDDEKHLAPLQLDVVERCVRLWTNPGDLVFSPFAGVGSEGVGALKLGRLFEGAEIKPEYFERACRNLRSAGAQLDLLTEEAS
jgi:hypothetical protein